MFSAVSSQTCRSCTLACHVSLAAALLQLSQLRVLTTNSTTSERCNSVPDSTSAATVSLTLSRRECGSVQMNDASARRAAARPRGLRSSSASSSFDSGSTTAQLPSRRSYRLHPRHVCCCTCFEMPAPMS